ncbi:unnamed protein product [Penicillium nalgiovense]|nr:unnamed protein product [Penicillium nalgiovense]
MQRTTRQTLTGPPCHSVYSLAYIYHAEELPVWVKHRPVNFLQAHLACVVSIPRLPMRHRLAKSPNDYLSKSQYTPFKCGLSVNWPYEALGYILSDGDSAGNRTTYS